ncbi:hypothetical protein QTS76_01630, partial [Micromonospora sp. b486]|nr:hypothetical protein [Micromonospora sp. b486]
MLPAGFWGQMFAFYGVLLSAGLIFGLLQAVGWAAGTWVVTRQAAGEPTGLGAAFRYGLRRALGLWGWTLLSRCWSRGPASACCPASTPRSR